MSEAKARRIAQRAHRGQLFGNHGLFIDHLARVARKVAESGGTPAEREAAWLYQIKDQLPAYVRPQVRAAALHSPLIQYAAAADRVVTGEDRGWDRSGLDRLADELGLPKAAPKPLLIPALRDGHWCRSRKTPPRPGSLALLITALTSAESCCVRSLVPAIFALSQIPELAAGVPDSWSNSDKAWERRVALRARLTTNPGRDFLLDTIATDREMADVAIRALTGPGDEHEAAVLRAFLADPSQTTQWKRRVAMNRLRKICPDGPVPELPLTPTVPPWYLDSTWLTIERAPELIARLDTPGWWFQAPYALGKLCAADAVPGLGRLALRSGDSATPAIDALGRIGSQEAVPFLVELTAGPHPDVRDHALRALARIGGERAIASAVAACDDLDPIVRDRAARTLTRIGDERATLRLIQLCDGSHAARAAAALGRIGDRRAEPTLLYLFTTAPDRATRHVAGRALARIGGPGLPHYHRVPWNPALDRSVHRAWVWLIGARPQPWSAESLRGALTDDDPLVRMHAVRGLAALTPDDLSPIASLLDDPDPRVRAAATAAHRHHHPAPSTQSPMP